MVTVSEKLMAYYVTSIIDFVLSDGVSLIANQNGSRTSQGTTEKQKRMHNEKPFNSPKHFILITEKNDGNLSSI